MMTAPHRHGDLRAIWTALFVTMLWSSSWVLIRMVLDDDSLAPITCAGLRYGLAAIVLCSWTLSRPRDRRALTDLDRATVSRLALLGVVLFSVTQGAQFVAIGNQPAASTSLVLSLTTFRGRGALGAHARRAFDPATVPSRSAQRCTSPVTSVRPRSG